MHRRTVLAALAAGACTRTRAQTPAAPTEAFDFVALGDMPYRPDAMVGPAYRHLIDLINGLAPPFSIHVGDFKDGLAACSDDEYQLQWRHFQRFASALVYTPGDNDWLDCNRRGDDPLERLQALRERFFSTPMSLGQRPIPLQRQSAVMPAYARYRENARWVHLGVVFATFHTVGQSNATESTDAAVRAEGLAREAANAAWISAAFDHARATRARALVVATQAESLRRDDPNNSHRQRVQAPFSSIAHTLLPLAEKAPFPVLLIHGDAHNYVTDQPFSNRAGQPITNLWRLQVFGEPRMHAVRVRVNTAVPTGAAPFSYSPIWNPLSTDPRHSPRPPR